MMIKGKKIGNGFTVCMPPHPLTHMQKVINVHIGTCIPRSKQNITAWPT